MFISSIFLLKIIKKRCERRDKMAKNWLDWVAIVLAIIGAVNWGLVGAINFNVVNLILGSISWLEKAVYVIVGLAGLYLIYYAVKK